MENNISTLLKNLSKLGVCATGLRYLDSTPKDFDTLVKVWKNWPEFLYEHSQNAILLLRKYLSDEEKEALANVGLFVDYRYIGEAKDDKIFIMGNSEVVLEFGEYQVSKVYMFNNSIADIIVADNSIVNIETFNNTKCKAIVLDNAQSFISQYDKSTVLSDKGIITEKGDYTRGNTFNGNEMTL